MKNNVNNLAVGTTLSVNAGVLTVTEIYVNFNKVLGVYHTFIKSVFTKYNKEDTILDITLNQFIKDFLEVPVPQKVLCKCGSEIKEGQCVNFRNCVWSTQNRDQGYLEVSL